VLQSSRCCCKMHRAYLCVKTESNFETNARIINYLSGLVNHVEDDDFAPALAGYEINFSDLQIASKEGR